MNDTAVLACAFLHMTARAVLVEVDGEEIWLPLSQLPDTDFLAGCGRGELIDLEVPMWLLEAKGLE